NVISENEFRELGLSSFLSTRIVRFREKGGQFYKPSDLLKIYNMDSLWYKKAVAWIAIPSEKKDVVLSSPVQTKKRDEKTDINLADSIQLVAVFGVGPKLSKRILTFRNKLGGFVSMQQLKDVYGLDSVVIGSLGKKFFVLENFQPSRKINLNTAAIEDLVANPYIRYKEANAILAYRMQHGNFASPDDLKGISILTPAWLEKVKPYLE
ncbi:MAG TPA: helix-hairpin-helix domain-containing protein, partial [Cyclobacteriaceae bacterium]|nr:helix-hairpin-helix domain-containing protein [Cyclobacteriaceae bacterium]